MSENTVSKQRKLFVVKGRESSTSGFEKYLKTRHWDIFSTTELKKALVMILSQPFEFAMISVDHPNPKCLRLPGIIAQTIKIPVILFSEGTNQNGINALRNSTHPYVLYPPVSGPAIERMILKIERDLYGTGMLGEALAPNLVKNMGTLAGDSSPNTFRTSGNFSMEDMVRLFEGDGGLARVDEGGVAGEGTKSATQGSRTSQFHKTASQSADTLHKDGAARESNPTGSKGMMNSLARDDAGHLLTNVLNPTKDLRSIETHGTDLRPVSSPNNADKASMLIRGAEHALSKSAVKGLATKPPSDNFSKCSKLGCFEINSDHFTGYLVVAFGTDRDVDDDFNRNLRQNLAGYLADNGIIIADNEHMDLNLNEVCFEEWSLKEASFLRKSIHGDSEIALAFFPFKKQEIQLELSVESHMYKMNISEIRSGVRLEFDIYLYLPYNQKYIRYVAKTKLLDDLQRSKLIASGFTEIHVRKESQKDVTRYSVQNFLNDKIKSYAAAA